MEGEREVIVFGRPALRQLMQYQEELLDKVKKKRISVEEFAKLYNKATLGLIRDVDILVRIMIFLGKLEFDVLEVILPNLFNLTIRRALDYSQELLRKPSVKQVKEL